MVSIKSLIVLALGATALAAPSRTSVVPSKVAARQASGAECGSNDYSSSDIAAAQDQGCQYQQNGQTVGSNDYPHRYNDYEGFDFSVPSPWYEFPILANGDIFDGSQSPSTDRVIFNDDCQLAGILTHTGASGDDFLECSYD